MAKYKQSPIGITHNKDSILHTGGSEDSYFLQKNSRKNIIGLIELVQMFVKVS